MRYVNILWPSDAEAEWKALFSQFCDIMEAEGMEDEDEDEFDKKVSEYILLHASDKLKSVMESVKKIEQSLA